MSALLRIPMALRACTDGRAELAVPATTVAHALGELTRQYPQLRRHLYGDDGALRSFVNVYLNEDDAREVDTPVKDGDVITIVPSIAGGSTADAETRRPGDAGTRDAAIPASPRPPLPASGAELSTPEILRYSRHLIMPEVGMTGQRRLKAARVLVVGAGGLGSPLGLYLAAAGVGTLGLADYDVVDETNLQRQVLHGTRDVGRSKLASAAERLRDVNPHVELRLHEARLTSENALDVLADYDVVVDGTDNFPTRYLLSDACVLLGKPNVYGSIFRFEGQVSVFYAHEGPCYRCLFRAPPPPGLVPSCAEGGVLGVLPGIIGSLQALETIKLILGTGDTLVGRLLLFDGLTLKFRELKLKKQPACPVCGPQPTITALIDYEEFCGTRAAEAAEMQERAELPEIGAHELKARLDAGEAVRIIDVREPHEWEIANLSAHGAELIPLGELAERMHELSSADEIVLHCRTGNRSARALRQLRAAGFRKLWNLRGGILAWAEEVEPGMPRY